MKPKWLDNRKNYYKPFLKKSGFFIRSNQIIASLKTSPAFHYNSSFGTLRLGGSRVIPGFSFQSGLEFQIFYYFKNDKFKINNF